MSNTSSSSSNRVVVPEAKEAMDKFKMEIADELGVPLTNGYNGNLTSYQNGSVGGYMVKKMIEEQEKKMAGKYSLSIRKAFAGKTGPHQFHLPCEGFFRVTVHALRRQ